MRLVEVPINGYQFLLKDSTYTKRSISLHHLHHVFIVRIRQSTLWLSIGVAINEFFYHFEWDSNGLFRTDFPIIHHKLIEINYFYEKQLKP